MNAPHRLFLPQANHLHRRFLLIAGVNLPRPVHQIHELRRLSRHERCGGRVDLVSPGASEALCCRSSDVYAHTLVYNTRKHDSRRSNQSACVSGTHNDKPDMVLSTCIIPVHTRGTVKNPRSTRNVSGVRLKEACVTRLQVGKLYKWNTVLTGRDRTHRAGVHLDLVRPVLLNCLRLRQAYRPDWRVRENHRLRQHHRRGTTGHHTQHTLESCHGPYVCTGVNFMVTVVFAYSYIPVT